MIIYNNLNLSFKPKLHYEELQYYLHDFNERQIENNIIYGLAEKLTNLAYPTYEDHIDRRWEYFYVPIRRNSKIIAIPVWVMEYNKEFFVIIQSFGSFHIKKGGNEPINYNKKIEKFYRNIITETLRFVPILKKDERILQKIVPYDIRTGKIKGRYVLDNLFSLEEKDILLKHYQEHIKKIEKNIKIKISLNDYLNVAAICYKAAYQEKTKNLSNVEMYKKWADGRDGGMLSIKDWDSKDSFEKWYHSGDHIGAHPFEIVFSWHEHGIHLYPPNSVDSNCYKLRVTNYAYAQDFINMVKQLIKSGIHFGAKDLENVLNYLAGDTYFTVNMRYEHYFRYILSREYKQKYFPYIEWDEIKVVKWK